MDEFTPALLKAGVAATIGKGQRDKTVIRAIRRFKALYLVAPAGCGAYLSKKVQKASVYLYRELGPEAIFRLEVKDFPCVVAIDSKGRNIYNILK
jgi:fumarate hydratase subunit beta